jgi:aspartyl-tRNA(Asn)/glutamyl-tRNA(Gln) amidotransferase subunit A
MPPSDTPNATELVSLYRERKVSPLEMTRAALDRIERFEPKVNAFIKVDAEGALAAARESEARFIKGEPLGPIDGIPSTIKDNLLMRGWPTRRGSLTTTADPATEDAPPVARMREQGAVFLGKTTLPEYGWIGACHSPLTGITRNPWKLDRTPGGSSGGAAVAALLNMGLLHIGNDAAGSVRIPSAFTGTFAIKPSFGRVPTYPASPFGGLSHQGPMTRTVQDCALLLNVISQPDPRDMMAWNVAWSPRLGYVKNVHPDVARATEKAASVFADLGAHVEDADPGFAEPMDMILTIWRATVRFIVESTPAGKRGQMDEGFLRVAERGRDITTTQYLAAHQARADLGRHMLRFHERYDLLLTPQMPTPAIEAGRVTPSDGSFGDEWINWSPFTYPFNLTQQPAASVPCGFSTDGLPVALQIVGPPRRDDLVLRAARAYERAHPFKMLDAPRD